LVTHVKYDAPRAKASLRADFRVGYSCKIWCTPGEGEFMSRLSGWLLM